MRVVKGHPEQSIEVHVYRLAPSLNRTLTVSGFNTAKQEVTVAKLNRTSFNFGFKLALTSK